MALVLASASAIRRSMLEQAGVDFEALPANLDEAKEKARHSDADAIATALSEGKDQQVSAKRPEDRVVGSDSVVSVDGRLFDKPRNRDQASEHLRFFAGKEMRLSSAVALARAGTVEWRVGDYAMLKVRDLSDAFIEEYLDFEWPEVGYCVGVFRLEGRGVQLFDSIEGSFFTILGMPLIPLLGALRERGLLPA